MLSKMTIKGFRGFSEKQDIEFAIPDLESEGSGLTTIVGANNSGKTSIGECLRYLNPNTQGNVHIPEDMRNEKTARNVKINFEFVNNQEFIIETRNSGSAVDVISNSFELDSNQVPFIVPSRRAVPQEFGRSVGHDANSRVSQMTNTYLYNYGRSNLLSSFNERILKWFNENDRDKFDDVLKKLLGYKFDWTMDTQNNGQHYLSFSNGQHTIDGLGDGVWSIFMLADALYDSSHGSIIVVDEPELSIHPSAQKKVMEALMYYSKDRQIVISTHSPYFVNWPSIINGGKLCRVVKIDDGCKIFQLDNKNVAENNCLISRRNPHTSGIESKEVFFLNDKIILVEGQEDIICFEEIITAIGREFKNYNFYGWGVSGSGNMRFIAKILENLGYKKVVMILDGDDDAIVIKNSLEEEFPNYQTYNLPVDDIRDKEKFKRIGDGIYEKKDISGLCDKDYRLKDNFDRDFRDVISEMFSKIDKYFEK